MVEAALNVAAQLVVEHSAYGRTLMRDGNRGPMAAPQGVYRSAGDDRWVAIAVTVGRAVARRCARRSAADAAAPPMDVERIADRIDAAIEAWTAQRSAREAAETLQTLGIPASPVTPSAELLHDPQLQARGFLEELDHPYVGKTSWPAMPIVLGYARASLAARRRRRRSASTTPRSSAICSAWTPRSSPRWKKHA